MQHDPDLSREKRIRLGREAIDLARANIDRWLLGVVTGNHGGLMEGLGEPEKAIDLYAEAHRLCREAGDASFTAMWASNLGWSGLRAGDTVEARARLEESLELAELIDEHRVIGAVTVNLGWLELIESDLELARMRFETATMLARRQGRRALIAEGLWGFAHLAAARGDPARAARLAGAASAFGRRAGFDSTALVAFTPHLDGARTALGEDAWEKAFADGGELDLDAALSLAIDR